VTHIFNERTKVDGVVDVGENLTVTETESIQLLIQILTTLKKIEFHLSLGTDTELKDQDAGG
jgi:hypothetical protein